jgi:hypothetical protein
LNSHLASKTIPEVTVTFESLQYQKQITIFVHQWEGKCNLEGVSSYGHKDFKDLNQHDFEFVKTHRQKRQNIIIIPHLQTNRTMTGLEYTGCLKALAHRRAPHDPATKTNRPNDYIIKVGVRELKIWSRAPLTFLWSQLLAADSEKLRIIHIT